jgi:hypothetical protein
MMFLPEMEGSSNSQNLPFPNASEGLCLLFEKPDHTCEVRDTKLESSVSWKLSSFRILTIWMLEVSGPRIEEQEAEKENLNLQQQQPF